MLPNAGKISILEPAMQQLQKMLFGEDGMSGYFGKDFSLDEKELESIADYLMAVSYTHLISQCSKAAHDSHSQYEWSNEQPVEYCRTIKK